LVVGAVVGAIGTLASGFVQDRWRRNWERETEGQRRAAVRAEEAADELLSLLDEITTALPPWASWSTHLDDERLDELSAELNRLAVKLGDSSARARVEDIARSITRTYAIANIMGHRPGKVGWRCHNAGRNVVAHVLSGEALEVDSVVDEYRAAMDEYDELQDEARQAWSPSAESRDDSIDHGTPAVASRDRSAEPIVSGTTMADAERMDSTDAAGTILELTEGWFPHSIDPAAVTGPEVALAGLARCRRLLHGIVELADVPDVAGVLARVLFETWLTSVYLLLGEDEAYEHLDRNDRINLHRVSKRLLEQLDADDDTAMESLRGQAAEVVSEERLTGELSVEAIAQKVRRLLEDSGDEQAGFPVRGYTYLYAPQSYASAHGGIGAIKQHWTEAGNVKPEISTFPTGRGPIDHLLDVCTALVGSLARRVGDELGLDTASLDEFAAEWFATLQSSTGA
jgi:hypothetical protein